MVLQLVGQCVSVQAVQYLRLDLGNIDQRADKTVDAVHADGALRLRQHGHKLDVDFGPLQGGRRWGQQTSFGHIVEGQFNQGIQQFVVQSLNNRTEHQQFFFMSLGHLGRCHLRVHAVGQHQEHIGIESAVDAGAHIVDVGQQVTQVQTHFKRRADGAGRRVHVDVGDTARQHVQFAVLQARRHLQGRVCLIVDALALA